MAQYQNFPGTSGGSKSERKLAALRLPDLKGKRFLDVGCNEGFFCGFARFDGAAESVGIDRSAQAIQRARLRFPDCRFLQQSWDQLPEARFDVILLASALHYADDQEALIHEVMGRLDRGGILVLEVGIAPGGGEKWVEVQRDIDERLFPTRGKLAEILDPYAWKIIGHSVPQAGDPVQRYVVQVSEARPLAYLLMSAPASGKTTIGRTLFAKAGMPVVSGDRITGLMSRGKIEVSRSLLEALGKDVKSTQLGAASSRMFSAGLGAELVDVWIAEGGGGDFALDSYVPEAYQPEVLARLTERGYVPVVLQWDLAPVMERPQPATVKARRYIQELQRHGQLLGPPLIRRGCLPGAMKDRVRWHLDHPRDGELLLPEMETRVAGWALALQEADLISAIYVRSPLGRQTFPLRRKRLDAVHATFGALEQAPAAVQDGICGFAFELPAGGVSQGVEIGLVLNDQDIPLVELGVAANGAVSLIARMVDGVRNSLSRGR